MSKEQQPSDVLDQANKVVIAHSTKELPRLGECGCHSCRLQAKGYSHFLNNT